MSPRVDAPPPRSDERSRSFALEPLLRIPGTFVTVPHGKRMLICVFITVCTVVHAEPTTRAPPVSRASRFLQQVTLLADGTKHPLDLPKSDVLHLAAVTTAMSFIRPWRWRSSEQRAARKRAFRLELHPASLLRARFTGLRADPARLVAADLAGRARHGATRGAGLRLASLLRASFRGFVQIPHDSLQQTSPDAHVTDPWLLGCRLAASTVRRLSPRRGPLRVAESRHSPRVSRTHPP
jgi:hypothetical protein